MRASHARHTSASWSLSSMRRRTKLLRLPRPPLRHLALTLLIVLRSFIVVAPWCGWVPVSPGCHACAVSVNHLARCSFSGVRAVSSLPRGAGVGAGLTRSHERPRGHRRLRARWRLEATNGRDALPSCALRPCRERLSRLWRVDGGERFRHAGRLERLDLEARAGRAEDQAGPLERVHGEQLGAGTGDEPVHLAATTAVAGEQ